MLSRLFTHIFGYRSAAPRSTGEMSRALRIAAQFADTDEQRHEYDRAADALDRIVTASERHSDAPTRDAFSYALGRAELDLGDKLDELIETSKETHIKIQEVQDAQESNADVAGIAWADFKAFGARLTAWRDSLELWRAEVDAALAVLTERLEAESDSARAATHQAMCDQIAELNERFRDMSQRIRDLEDQLIAEGPREGRVGG